MKLRPSNPFRSHLATLAALIAVPSASAAPYNWTGLTNGTWNTTGNWSGSLVPTIADDLTILGPTNVAGALTINFNADNSARSIDFTNTAATSVTNTSSGSNRLLTLGSGGMTTGAGAVQFGSATANQAVNIALGAAQAWNIGAGGMTVNNIISGGASFGLTKTGAGTLVLKGTNSFSGGLTIKAGTVSSDGGGSGGNFLGSGTVTLGDTANTGAAATLNFNGSNFTSTNAISVVGNGVSTLQVNGWSQALNGNVSLSNNLTVVTNNAFGSSMTLGGTGAFTGTGNLIIQSNAINNSNISSNITFSGSGGINMNGSITNSGTGSSSGSGNINTTISALIGTNVTGITQNSTNSQLIFSNANSSYTSNITVTAGTLSAITSKTGSNPTTSVLGNAQTAGRTVTIASAGALNFGATDIMGDGGSVPVLKIIANGGTIKNSGNFFNVLGPVELNGGTLSSVGGAIAAFPSFALRGTVTVGGSTVSTISNAGSNAQMGLESGTGTTFDVADAVSGSGSDLNVTGVLVNWNSNSGFLIKSGVGTMTLSGVNTYTGGTRIDNGTLALANTGNNALVNTGAVNVNGGTLALGTFTETVGAVTLTSGSITGNGAGALTGTSYDVRSGSASAILAGSSVALTKTTAGIVTLSGANTYTGATAVNDGILAINGNQSTANGAVTVGTGATLKGSGTVGGATTIQTGGTHNAGAHANNTPAPLAPVGTQTFSSNLSYSSQSIFAWDLGGEKDTATGTRGTDYDAVNVSGNLSAYVLDTDTDGGGPDTITPTPASDAIFRVIVGSSFDFTTVFWDAAHEWSNIFSVTGTTNGWAPGTAVGVYNYDFANNTYTPNSPTAQGTFTISGSTLNWTAVPEPSSALAGLLLAAGLLRRRRK